MSFRSFEIMHALSLCFIKMKVLSDFYTLHKKMQMLLVCGRAG